MYRRKVLLALAMVTASATTEAQSYNFNSFATQGQSFQGVTLGVMTLSSQNGSLVYTSLYGGGIFDGSAATNDVTMTFSTAINSITIRAGDGGGDLDAFGLSVFAFGSNAFLGSFYTTQFGGPNEPEWYTLNVSGLGNIGRVVFDPCNSGICPGSNADIGGVAITDIDIPSAGIVVPEPTTAAMMLVGLAGALTFVRRRRV